MKTCAVDGCERASRSRGMCSAHYQRFCAGQPLEPPIMVRPVFEERYVLVDSGCWEWQGRRTPDGYGTFGHKYAHRISYERHVGPIPAGLVIDHLCRNPPCVNPEHLEPVTNRINMLRGMAPAAQVARTNRCMRGHELTPENTRVRIIGKGYRQRQCVICNRERRRKNRKRRRQERSEQLAANPSIIEHGNMHAYREWLCRCQSCGAAQTIYERGKRARRRERLMGAAS